MNKPIKTNKLKIKLNFKALNETYNLFKVTTSDDKIKYGAKILDTPVLNKKVKSIFSKVEKAF